MALRVLASFPGKYGDILWALPALRALSRRLGRPIDLAVAAPFASLCPLIEAQDYIGRCWAEPTWQVQETAPMTPRVPPLPDGIVQQDDGYDRILHLGYRGWPQRPLPYETLDCLNAECDKIPWKPSPNPAEYGGLRWQRIPDTDLALTEPWITVPPVGKVPIVTGFTDEHFELKVGLLHLLARPFYGQIWPVGKSPRWSTEADLGGSSWEVSAGCIRAAQVFVGDCSALHVLACAVGTPCVLMEPSEARWHPIFYPYGTIGPQVTLVCGGDGHPTFDARAVRAAVDQVLARRQEIRP